MPRAAKAQMRILKIAELLSCESSPGTPLKASNILRCLEKQNMCITRTTLKNDIAALRECGFDIKSISLPSGEYYYLGSEQSSNDEAEELIMAAVRNKTQLCVSLHGSSGEYFVSPYAVLRDESGYYTACYSSAHRRIVLLPFAKLKTVHKTDTPVLPPPADYSSLYYTDRGFELCQSACETITLSFTDDALADVRSRFGNNIKPYRDPSGIMRVEISTEVGISLFAWIFRLGGRVRIISPDHVCHEYKNSLRAQLAAY